MRYPFQLSTRSILLGCPMEAHKYCRVVYWRPLGWSRYVYSYFFTCLNHSLSQRTNKTSMDPTHTRVPRQLWRTRFLFPADVSTQAAERPSWMASRSPKPCDEAADISADR